VSARKNAKSALARFSDEQWAEILRPFGDVKIPIGYRQTLVALSEVLQELRSLPDRGFVEERDQIERISKHSTALREAIQETGGSVPGISYIAFAGDVDFYRAEAQWRDFVEHLSAVQRAARRVEAQYVGRKAPPTNVDVLRNATWSQLNQLYQLITGHEPKFKVATATTIGRREGEVYGDFVEFVQAFTATVPGEEKPTGNAIREFIRRHGRTYSQAEEW